MTEFIKHLDFDKLKVSEASRLAKETTDVDVIIALSRHREGQVRKNSLVQMCPCRVKQDIDKFWDRVFEMVNDPDPIVRAQVNKNIKHKGLKKSKFILSKNLFFLKLLK